jgi:hypothetical protein
MPRPKGSKNKQPIRIRPGFKPPSKEWLEKAAKLEEGCSVEAGSSIDEMEETTNEETLRADNGGSAENQTLPTTLGEDQRVVETGERPSSFASAEAPVFDGPRTKAAEDLLSRFTVLVSSFCDVLNDRANRYGMQDHERSFFAQGRELVRQRLALAGIKVSTNR